MNRKYLKDISPALGRKPSTDGGFRTKGLPATEMKDELIELVPDEEREQEKEKLYGIPHDP